LYKYEAIVFYAQEWKKAIFKLQEALLLESNYKVVPKGMTHQKEL
jgi:hypothetical protein